MTPKHFCDKHNACLEGREWALSTGCATMDDLWQRDDWKPRWRVWAALRPGVLSDTEARQFACWCVRQVWPLLTDERSKHAVEVAERFARGLADEVELAAARDAAWDTAGFATAAAWAATGATAWAAASAAASAAAWAAAWAAARPAARAKALAAARDAALAEQSKYLLAYTTPRWE